MVDRALAQALDLVDFIYDPDTEIWEVSYNDFTETGSYKVIIYAEDIWQTVQERDIMLFHPYEPPKLWRWRVGFFQGAVPKNQPRLAAAIGRTVGWIAHWKEMMDDPNVRIGRPRQIYTGATRREFVPVSQR